MSEQLNKNTGLTSRKKAHSSQAGQSCLAVLLFVDLWLQALTPKSKQIIREYSIPHRALMVPLALFDLLPFLCVSPFPTCSVPPRFLPRGAPWVLQS